MRDNAVLFILMAGLILAVPSAILATYVAVRTWDKLKSDPLAGNDFR